MLVSMKALKTISGFSGAVLLIYWLLGIIFDFHVSFYFFIAGLILFGLVYFPLTLLDKHRRENRWDTIRGDKKEQPHSQAEGGKKNQTKRLRSQQFALSRKKLGATLGRRKCLRC